MLILIGVVVYFIWTVKEFRLNRRQANFIDSVTHELKSPIASMKLCLQTLELRSVTPEQQHEFQLSATFGLGASASACVFRQPG